MSGKPKKHTLPISQKLNERRPAVADRYISDLMKRAPLLILIFTALLYSRAIFNGFTSFDDDSYIVNNPVIRNFSLENIKAIFTSFYVGNYHPFTMLAYLFEYTCFGPDPLIFHLVNVLIHLANTWLVFILAESLSGKRITAIVVSVLFAIHPMHVESVAWASELKDVLYAMFYLLSLLYYLRYTGTGFRLKYYIVVLLFFSASLFSKPAAVTLPVLLIAIDMYQGRKINKSVLLEKVPLLLLSVLFGVLNLLAQNADKAFTDLSQTYNILSRIFLVASSLSFYLLRLIAPFNLSAMHFFPRQHNNMLPWEYYTSLPFVVFIIILLVLMNKSSLRKEILFGFAFFLITISVMLQIIAVGSILSAERYTYIPYIGLFYIIGQWVSGLGAKRRKPVFIGVFSFVIIIYSVQTLARIGVWENDTTLYTDIREKDPKVSRDMAYGFSLSGNDKKNAGDYHGAIKYYSQAILLYPEFYESYCNRGYAFQKLGDGKPAMDDFNKAILLHPEFADAYNSRGGMFFEMHDLKSAMDDFNKAISIKPDFAEAYTNRGWEYFVMRDTKSALDDYDKAISIKPEYAAAYNSRGWIYFTMGDTRSAMEDYDKAIQLKPGFAEAYCNMGWAYNNQGDTKQAIAEYNKAISLNPQYAVAYNDRGMAYYGQSDPKSAISDYTTAISLDPSFENAYANRGWAYIGAGDAKSALMDYSKVVSLNPQNALAYDNLASIKANTGDLTGALEDYSIFLKLNPNDSIAYFNRGTVRYNLKDTRGACEDWTKAIALGNKTPVEFVRKFCH